MRACTFCGHRNAPDTVYNLLLQEIERLITCENVEIFYVGNNGKFDFLAKKAVCALTKKYENINYFIVLAYRPLNGKLDTSYDFSRTILPEEVASTPPKYAISARNKWMVERSEFVISYITHDFGGAYKTLEFCEKKNKKIINIAEALQAEF